jgi:hypothetical protein
MLAHLIIGIEHSLHDQAQPVSLSVGPAPIANAHHRFQRVLQGQQALQQEDGICSKRCCGGGVYCRCRGPLTEHGSARARLL